MTVLPFDPVMPTTVPRNCARQWAASSCSAATAFSTRTNPQPGSSPTSRSTRKARTPRPYISATKSCESWLAPRMATKSGSDPSSQVSDRLSVTTERTSVSQPEKVPPTIPAIRESL